MNACSEDTQRREIGRIRELRIGVKVLDGGKGQLNVYLPNLTDEELATLTVSTNVRTMGRNWAMMKTFPNWPASLNLWPFEDHNADPPAQAIREIESRPE